MLCGKGASAKDLWGSDIRIVCCEECYVKADTDIVVGDARVGAAVRRALAEYQTAPVSITALRYWAKGLRNARKPLAAYILEAIAQAFESEADRKKERTTR